MALAQLEDFMGAIRRLESGGNYLAQGPVQPNGNRALGAYQIMQSNWSAWANEAGIPGADWRDPAAQDRIARYKMRQYYQRFQSWELVAVAWFAGPGRAATAMKEGSLASVGGLKDSLGTSVSGYVDKVMGYMPRPSADPAIIERLDPQAREAVKASQTPQVYRSQPDAPRPPDALTGLNKESESLEFPFSQVLRRLQTSPLPPQAAPQAQQNRAALESRMTALVQAMSRLVAGGAMPEDEVV